MHTKTRLIHGWLSYLSSIPLILCGSGLGGQFQFANQTLTVPDGFEVEQVAGPPLVNRPIEADFDEQGRLYVTDSSGSNDKTTKQLQDKPHRVVRLEDTDGDGHFDKSVVFAEKMMFPEGAMWFNGSLYVSAPPSIWKLTDTDNDGVADQREEWFQGKTLTGCANDLHGPYPGLDGWIYWCKGAFAEQTYERPGKRPFVTKAAHIFRAHPDATDIEPVMTGGMDNPVGVAFTTGGERIFTTTFFQHPEAGRRDGLVHAIYGGVYGKVHNVIDDHKKTGELMPVLTHLGAAAPCGITRYEASGFGAEYQDNLFACLFNMHKITRHVLEPEGATFRSHDSDFLTSDSTDFHPTDVLEDADGSLLVVNTGGWYKLCCPTSQLWKPDLLGAIYRVRRKGAPRIDDPRGLKLAWASMTSTDLTKLLGDQRPAVRKRVIQQLAKLGTDAIPPLAEVVKKSTSSEERRNALWTLTRIDTDSSREAVRAALNDRDAIVRQVAVHSAGLRRDQDARTKLVELLRSSNPALRRATAEALGRIGHAGAVKPLLEAVMSAKQDRVLEHSLIYALIEIADQETTRTGLRASNSSTRHAALIALDQMEGGNLKAEEITSLLVSSDPVLKETAAWVVSHHPDWGGALAGFFHERLADKNLSDSERSELQLQLSQLARDPSIQELIVSEFNNPSASNEKKLLLLRAMAHSSLKEPPHSWLETLQRELAEAQKVSSSDESLLRQLVATVRALPIAKTNAVSLTEPLLQLGRNTEHSADLRLDALAAISGGLPALEPELFEFLCARITPATPVTTRSSAVTVLARAKLSPEQLLALTDSLKIAGPLEISKLLSVFDGSHDETTGLKLIAALKESKGLSSLRADLLKPRLTNFPEVVQQKGEELLALINADASKQRAHLDELAASLQGGDIRRGQSIFNSPKAACSACHAIGYLGGKAGPDLTKIGQIRTERDLLESIVYPSASFVRSYEPMVVATKSGEDYSGVVRKDAPDEVVLATGPETEVRLARADIVEMRPSTISIMPQGLDEQLTRQELADLVAFLKATQW